MLLLHMATHIRRDLPTCFLESGYHFWGTLIFQEQIASQWKLNMLETAFITTLQKMYQAERFIARFYTDQADHDQEKNVAQP
jgi:3'-phosphoadenosine 5'-phosphosulfate sulfotransferase (PAPS reductase)/FAD synthetase